MRDSVFRCDRERGSIMRPKERRDTGEPDLFRARLDQIIDLDHALGKLAQAIDWRFLEGEVGAVYSDEPGRPPLPTRPMGGVAIPQASYKFSREVPWRPVGEN